RNQIDRSLSVNKLQLSKLEKLVKENGEIENEKTKILQELLGLMDQIKSEANLIQIAGQELQSIVKVNDQVVLGPHMKSHDYLLKIKNHGKNIEVLVQRFNTLNRKIREETVQ
ncbi:MAG: hypothetical protein KDD40_04010, partial [Bdellovibrionales bacterium]|nr:hypothetical protein [Bdellovibrionales bacterium]